ncbi:helix-turn-helix domain-containing protein [Catellatospora methionotrophica]|uniref:helix-turn-helix domain-containing protein n=1 Tax=Catellatospora methionotrophica TaxID=121620 RepID=UPI0033ECD14E
MPSALRTAREAAGYSLARMAALTHFSKPYLGLVETGRRTASADVIERYEQILGVTLGTALDPVRITHEWLIAEMPAAAHTRAGRRIGVSLVEALDARVVQLRHLDDTVSSSHMLPVIIRELDEATALARDGVFTEDVGRRLFTVVGELAQLAGWVASDAGQYVRAQQLYLSGLSATETIGDRVLGAQLLSSLSYQIANVGRRDDALLIARSAVKGATGATPVVRALLLERYAWAAARLRDADTTRRVLDAVDDAFEQRAAGVREPEWVYWLNRAEIDVMAARCAIELGAPAQAEPLLTQALASYNTDHVREVALYQTWLAESYAKTGALDAARATVDRAQAAAVHADSARLQRRITAVVKLIDRWAT